MKSKWPEVCKERKKRLYNEYVLFLLFCYFCLSTFLELKKEKKIIPTEAEHKAGIFMEVLYYPRILDPQHLMIFIDVRRKRKEVWVGVFTVEEEEHREGLALLRVGSRCLPTFSSSWKSTFG